MIRAIPLVANHSYLNNYHFGQVMGFLQQNPDCHCHVNQHLDHHFEGSLIQLQVSHDDPLPNAKFHLYSIFLLLDQILRVTIMISYDEMNLLPVNFAPSGLSLHYLSLLITLFHSFILLSVIYYRR